jgi:hypothetical protein
MSQVFRRIFHWDNMMWFFSLNEMTRSSPASFGTKEKQYNVVPF